MKRSPLSFILCLAVILVLAACRSDGDPAPTFEPTSTLTADEAAVAVAGTVESMTGSLRGEEVTEIAPEPDTTATPAVTPTPTKSKVIFSVPFEVRPDGFSFRNYGGGFPEGDFTVDDLRAQFGDGVCSRIEEDSDRCVPTAEALQWIADRNADMAYGHCIGFTVTSYQFAEGDLQVGDFGPPSGTTYDIEQRADIMRTIAANGSLYWVESVWSSEVGGTPREVLDALIALGEPVDLSIYLPGLTGGHSLLAYGVAEVAPEQYYILVYDNNFPGEQGFVEVDYAANTWRYAQGAVNPDETAVPYQGDATTDTLRFIPLSAYDSVSCPFCPPEDEQQDGDVGVTLLSFLGQGDVLVKTALGNIGVVAGEIINDLPGARLLFQRGQLAANDSPDIVLPAGLDYTVEFNNMQRVSSLSQEGSIVLDQLSPVTDQSTLAVELANRTVAFQAGGDQTPVFKTTVRQEDTTFSVALLGIDFASGQSVTMSAAANNGTLEITSNDTELTDATLLVTRLTSETEAIFATTSLNVAADSSVALDLAGWDGESGVDVYSDEDGDGDYDEEPETLANEPLTSVIQQSDPAAVATIVGNLSPFLGDQGMDSVLATLADQDLSGQEIGDILRPLNLPIEQLISLIDGYALPVPELAELIFALRLEPEPLDDLILGLDLSDEDEAELREALENLALYAEIIAEWEFLNSKDVTQLATLLNERELTAEQLVALFPRMELTDDEIELVLGNMTLSESDLAFIVEELELDLAAVLAVTPEPTATITPTPTSTGTTTPTPTMTPTTTATATPAAVLTIDATASPTGEATPPLPLTQTPDPYPYPGEPPLPTRTPEPYPYPGPNSTVITAFETQAFCEGDDLRIIAEEPTWINAGVEIWMGETKLIEGTTGPNGEAYEITFTGPSTWAGLYLVSDKAPQKIILDTLTCPN